MNNKHTRGPWSYSIYRNYVRIYLHGLGRIDKIYGGDSLRGYCGEANAKLIAAAPEMLDALKLVVDTFESGGWPSATIAIAKATIAKAEGNDATAK